MGSCPADSYLGRPYTLYSGAYVLQMISAAQRITPSPCSAPAAATHKHAPIPPLQVCRLIVSAQAACSEGVGELQALNRRQLAAVLALVVRAPPPWARARGAPAAGAAALVTRCHLPVPM